MPVETVVKVEGGSQGNMRDVHDDLAHGYESIFYEIVGLYKHLLSWRF
ncbi:hypothetical protein BCSJ1_11258 [Bacillus cereus SJ1]|nr:hypothetical protein BCSJ1_11258 [Bacillus cereus SJ1]